MISKSSDTGSCARAKRTPKNGLLRIQSPSSIKEVRFSEQEFYAGKPASNIKYDHLKSKNDNLFYFFHNQLDYALAHSFAKSETMKGNVNKFLSDLLMAPLTKKLSYPNTKKWIEH